MTDTDKTPALSRQVGGGHYKDFAIQPVEFCMVNGLNACQSAIVKYLMRDKNSIREDLEKSIHYAELWGELVEKYRLPHWGRSVLMRRTIGLPYMDVDTFARANHLSEPVREILHLIIDEPNQRTVTAASGLIRGLIGEGDADT